MIKEINFKLKLNKANATLNNLTDEQFQPINLKFDFENNKLTINDKKTLKVENDYEYTYKFMKTKVKAIDGINGLYNHIKEASDPEYFWNKDFWNNRMYLILLKTIK